MSYNEHEWISRRKLSYNLNDRWLAFHSLWTSRQLHPLQVDIVIEAYRALYHNSWALPPRYSTATQNALKYRGYSWKNVIVSLPIQNGGFPYLCKRLPEGKSHIIPSNPIKTTIKPNQTTIFHLVLETVIYTHIYIYISLWTIIMMLPHSSPRSLSFQAMSPTKALHFTCIPAGLRGSVNFSHGETRNPGDHWGNGPRPDEV